MRQLSFKRYRFPPDIIRHAIWLYARFTLSFRDVEEMLAERGLDVSYETIRRRFLKFGTGIAALAEGLVFAEQIGLAPAEFLELARGSAAASKVMDIKGPLMVARDFVPQGRVSQSAKDFNLMRDAALACGQRLPFTDLYLTMMQDCIDHGEADLDNAAIIKALARARSQLCQD